MEKCIMTPRHYDDLARNSKPSHHPNGLTFNGIPVICDPRLPDHMSPMIMQEDEDNGTLRNRFSYGHTISIDREELDPKWLDQCIAKIKPKECNHNWKCDYQSAFVKKDYFSCTKCGKKKEDL